jgi:hypothetical protein
MNESKTERFHATIVIALSLAVLLYRIAAWLSPSTYVVNAPSTALALNALGVWFLGCGVWAWARRPAALTRLFLTYAVGMGLHWGGSIGTESEGIQVALLCLYISASAMGDGAFLELSLRYPRGEPQRALRRTVFYAPAILLLLATPLAPFLPRATVGSGIGVVIGLSFGMSIAGGVTFVVHWLRAAPASRRMQFLTPIVGAIVLSACLDLLADAGVLPGEPGFWKLSYGCVPIALAWALTRRQSAGPDRTTRAAADGP